MKRTGKPSGKVTLLGTYDVDHDNHIVYLLGVDEIGKHYSIEEHEYNVGSAYSVYRDYYILEDSEIVDLRQRVRGKLVKVNPIYEDSYRNLWGRGVRR